MITRRILLAGLGATQAGLLQAAPERFAALPGRLAALEAASGGRLGVAVRDTGSGREAGHRTGERFPLCSTFKVLAAAALLARVDAGSERLDRIVPYSASDLVAYSPVTSAHAEAGGLPLDTLCAAAITRSDNTAGNLLLAAIGGPAGLTAYMRGLGDAVTRLDRTEPTLNEARPGDPRDTTSPAAMLASLDRLLLGSALAPGSRDRLLGWLIDNRTGDARLRAGLPRDWRVGDKTGTGENGTTNDVAILYPPGAALLLVTVYLTECGASLDARNDAIAAIGRAIAA